MIFIKQEFGEDAADARGWLCVEASHARRVPNELKLELTQLAGVPKMNDTRELGTEIV